MKEKFTVYKIQKKDLPFFKIVNVLPLTLYWETRNPNDYKCPT